MVIALFLLYAAMLVAGMRLAQRLGYPYWYGIGIGIPIVQLLVLGWFAFARSPRDEEIDRLREENERLRLQHLLPPG
jgi:hypothetical protein